MGADSADQRSKSSSTFNGIQVLRGIAAGMVVIHHASILWSDHTAGNIRPAYWSLGAAGVDIFFVISGFVMAISTIGKGDGPGAAKTFIERRFVRIYPLYWLITTVLLVKMLLVQMHPGLGAVEHGALTMGYIVSSYLLIPYINSLGDTSPLLTVGWTLSYEMFFYLCFAGALATRRSVVKVVTATLLVVMLIGIFHKDSWPGFTVLASPMLFEFLAGLWLGRALQNGFRINATISALLGIAGIIGFLAFPHYGAMRFLTWGLPALLVVTSTVMLEDRFKGPLVQWFLLLGDASYALYLSHELSFSLCLKLLMLGHILPAPGAGWRYEVVTVLTCLIISIFVALALHLFVEKPINAKLRRGLNLRTRKTELVTVKSA
jgi:peptidoglycan/LPS O-acetylase OafA/YrhL